MTVKGLRITGSASKKNKRILLVGYQYIISPFSFNLLLPARASEQGNVIGLVSVYIFICTPKKL